MARQRWSELLLHNFPENGVKLLLHHPDNLQDLMRLLAQRYPILPDPKRFDFTRTTIEADTFVRAELNRGVCASATASADWMTEAANPSLRGGF